MGNTPNLLSLQVEGLHLPSRLVPKAGSLSPASVPHMSWQKPSNTFMASAPHLCIGISFSGVWGDEKEQGSLSWSELHDNTRHENQTRSSLGVARQIPFLFSFSCSLFCFPDPLTAWLSWNRKSGNTTEESELSLWCPWLSQTPETVEIHRPARFRVMCGPPR